MTYKSIVVTRRGGPEVIQIVENELRPPAAGEVQVKILASPVCQDDVAVRVGNRPFWRSRRSRPAIPSWTSWMLLAKALPVSKKEAVWRR